MSRKAVDSTADETADALGAQAGSNIMSANSLMETTKNYFGDYASILLDGHAVVPLNNTINIKAAIKDWQLGWDPNVSVDFHSLAILTGERSGITVWDIDDTEAWSPPVPANVITTNGQHIYTPYEGEKGKIGLAPKSTSLATVDIQSSTVTARPSELLPSRHLMS